MIAARLLLALATLADLLSEPAFKLHLTTDPACSHYKAPRRGSRLDRASRGVGCLVCRPYSARRKGKIL